MDKEISKTDPKCWECGTLVIPKKVFYGPLRCASCQEKRFKKE